MADGWAKIIQAVASLLWPLLGVFLLLRFGPVVKAIVDSARSRKFTLKIGGQELTMEEVNQQQGVLIADLQSQVVALRHTVDSGAGSHESETHEPTAARGVQEHATEAVLWVDDNPRNNSYFIQRLEDLAINVDLATSTDEGVQRFQRRKYRLVISDMGREEDGSYRPEAGLALLRRIRTADKSIPVFIYCSRTAARRYEKEALDAGANGITASATELSGLLFSEINRWTSGA